jgi:hypothetical protein
MILYGLINLLYIRENNIKVFYKINKMEQSKKKKLERQFSSHRNPNFGISMRNNDPIILLPPEGYIPLTTDRYNELIANQKKWASEYMEYKKINTKYHQNKEAFSSYHKNYMIQKKENIK